MGGSRNRHGAGTNRSQARSQNATAAGYFFPSRVPAKSASAA
ncbi:MAG TPA: hypothetical protein VMI73_21690 [Trebonia sp.]|nr:hypothetical protein [Trebonia sp.]